MTGPAVTEILNELKGIVDKPLSPEELTIAKDGLANSLPGAFETNANAVSNYSNVFTYDLGLDYYANYAEQVRAVTLPQTAAVAQRYIVPNRLVIVAVGDKSKIEPELKKLNLPIEYRDAEGKLNPVTAKLPTPKGVRLPNSQGMFAWELDGHPVGSCWATPKELI